MADEPGKRDVRKQRFQVRCSVVTYIFSFFFNLVEKILLRVKGVVKMAALAYERENCGAENRDKAYSYTNFDINVNFICLWSYVKLIFTNDSSQSIFG